MIVFVVFFKEIYYNLIMENLEKVISDLIRRVSILEEKVFHIKENEAKKEPNVEKLRDKTKYLFEGSIYSKNRLVLSVVKSYVNKYSNTTFSMLQKTFDKSLQGSLGVVTQYELVKNKLDAKKRYFIDEPILLNNQKIVVCTQWGAFNINKFITRAQELGFTITKINY